MKKIAFSLMLACSGLLCTAPAFADDSDTVTLRVAWWGANSRHQNTLKTIRAFEQAHPNINCRTKTRSRPKPKNTRVPFYRLQLES